MQDNDWARYQSLVSTRGGFDTTLGALIEQFGEDKRNTLENRSLIYAVLAWAARQTAPSDYRELSSRYCIKAVRMLNNRIEEAKCCADEIFAANLLAWVAYSTCSKEIEAHIHFKASLVMLNFLSDTGPLSTDLIVFGPFIIDCANAWTIRNGVIPSRRTTFSQRVSYFDKLRLTGNSCAWYSGTLEAANSTLGNLLEVSLTSVCQLAKKERDNDFTRDTVENVLRYLRAELGDIHLHSALRTLYQSFQGPQTNHTTVEGQLITRLFHRLRCVLLLHTVLEAPTIQEGVRSPQTRFIARKIISFCRIQAIRRGGPIEDYYLISWHNFSYLLLGGIALSREECSERMLPYQFGTKFSL